MTQSRKSFLKTVTLGAAGAAALGTGRPDEAVAELVECARTAEGVAVGPRDALVVHLDPDREYTEAFMKAAIEKLAGALGIPEEQVVLASGVTGFTVLSAKGDDRG